MLNLSVLVLIARISDSRNVATNQSLFQVTLPGLAILFGVSLMGWKFDHWAAEVYFGLCMLLLVAGALMMLVMYRDRVPSVEDDH